MLGWPEQSWSPFWAGGDYLSYVLGTAILGLLSIAVAIVWSLVDRRPSHPRLFAVTFTATRLVLAALMLSYGWVKILPVQFRPGAEARLVMQPVAQLSPMALLWTFMAASRLFTVFAGLVEFAGGVFLLSRRTVTLGALLSTAAMTNVLVLNVAYDVGVKVNVGKM